jgi:hypothetical protein
VATQAPRCPDPSPVLGMPSQTPSHPQNAIFTSSRVCKFPVWLCKFRSQGGSISLVGSLNVPSPPPPPSYQPASVLPVFFTPWVAVSNTFLTRRQLVPSGRVGQFRLRVGQDHLGHLTPHLLARSMGSAQMRSGGTPQLPYPPLPSSPCHFPPLSPPLSVSAPSPPACRTSGTRSWRKQRYWSSPWAT